MLDYATEMYHQVYSLSINAKLDINLYKQIADRGYSRIPVYNEEDGPKSLTKVFLVKSALFHNLQQETLIKSLKLRELLVFSPDTPLYDALAEFQSKRLHMAVVQAPGSREVSMVFFFPLS